MTDHFNLVHTLGTGGGVLGAPTGGAGNGGTAAAPGTAPGNTPAAPSGLGPIFPILLAIMAFMIITTIMSGRKEKKKRAEMMSSLGKHDRVQTIGGIIGVIQELRDDEVVLRVDESSNTRIRFARSAVQQVLKSGGAKKDEADELDVRDPEAVSV